MKIICYLKKYTVKSNPLSCIEPLNLANSIFLPYPLTVLHWEFHLILKQRVVSSKLEITSQTGRILPVSQYSVRRTTIMQNNNNFSRTTAVFPLFHLTLCPLPSLYHSPVSHCLFSFNAFLHPEATDQTLCFSKLLVVTFGAMEDDQGECLSCRDAAGGRAWMLRCCCHPTDGPGLQFLEYWPDLPMGSNWF